MMPKFIPPCREVASRLAHGEFEGASWRARLILRVHLFMCRHCRRFAGQMRLVSEGLRTAWKGNPSGERLNAARRRILSRLKS